MCALQSFVVRLRVGSRSFTELATGARERQNAVSEPGHMHGSGIRGHSRTPCGIGGKRLRIQLLGSTKKPVECSRLSANTTESVRR